MENLTKQQAYEKMLQGCKVRHEYYTDEEYVLCPRFYLESL